MKKLLLLGLGVSGINAQVVDPNLRAYIGTTAAQVAPYTTPAVAFTPGAPPMVTAVPGAANPATPAAQFVIPGAPIVLSHEQRQAIEMEQINAELANFFSIHSVKGGTISDKDWLAFASGLAARHPEILELRCDRPSGTGRTYIRFANPFYLNFSAVSPWCRLYVRPYVTAPLNPYP